MSCAGTLYRETRRSARGFTLTELMIGLAIGLTVIAAAGQLFSLVRARDRLMKNRSEIAAGTRFLLFRFNPRIRQSGYYGITAAPSGLRFLVNRPRRTACAQLPWPELVRRRTTAFSAATGIPRCIRHQRRNNRYLRGDALILNPSSRAPERKLSRLRQTSPGAWYIHSLVQQQSIFTGRNADRMRSSPPLALRRLDSAIYYIGDHPDVYCRKQPVPGLIRITRSRTGRYRREMVQPGFEHLRLAFGVANNKRSRNLNYRSAEQIRHWHQVRTMRYWILLRTRCPARTRPLQQRYRLHDEIYQVRDRYYRKLVVMTVALRNPARQEKTE